MKRLASILCFVAEAAAFYAWQWQGIAAVGRVLIFYYWAIAFLMLVVGALVLLAAVLLKQRDASPTEGMVSRAFGWSALIARVVMLVVVSHQFLATVYLVGNLFCRLGIAVYRTLPEKTAKEGV